MRYFLAVLLDGLKHIFTMVDFEKCPAEAGPENNLLYVAVKPCAARASTNALFSLPVRVPSLPTV